MTTADVGDFKTRRRRISGVDDSVGNLLDGNHGGRVSGNYVAIFKLALPKGRRR